VAKGSGALPSYSVTRPLEVYGTRYQNSDAGGSVDCPDKYAVTYPECVVSGGRASLMKKAIQSAKDGDYANAFRLAQICQCHNVNARDKIRDAGQKAVGDYLKTK
jgi:hypothetical protein